MAAIVPGKPDESLLIDAVRYDDADLQMPPHGKLPPEDIAMLTSWVSQVRPLAGPAGSGEQAAKPVAADGPNAKWPAGFDLAARKRQHWAWQGVKRVPPPAVDNRAWPINDIDRFILAKLQAQGLEPAGPADPGTLLRRLSFDLLGLPPTPAELAEFLADPSPERYEHAVDRLLDSPRFGERWARHWLDRVMPSRGGHEHDYDNSNATAYRDYVVRAINADVPYDQFVREHIAGDLLDTALNAPGAGLQRIGAGHGLLVSRRSGALAGRYPPR